MSRYTPEQMRTRVAELEEQSVAPGEVDDVGLADAAMLRQAADDAERRAHEVFAHGDTYTRLLFARAEVETLTAALAAAEADAARYRWLRNNADPSGEVPYITRQVCNSWGHWVDDVELTGAVMDSAIDAARNPTKEG